jgi:hypothetical protein
MWVGTPLFVASNDRSAVKCLEVAGLVTVAADPCVAVASGLEAIGPKLASTDGTSRRLFGLRSSFGLGVTVHSDHHPTECDTSLSH